MRKESYFLLGCATGAFLMWLFTRRKANDEEIYEDEDYIEEKIPVEEPVKAFENNNVTKDITSFSEVLKDNNYKAQSVDYRRHRVKDIPYVIPPAEFGELTGYEQVSLTFHSDDVLTDDLGELVDDDIGELIGEDFSTHFGEYEEDSVYIRNDSKRCDYEILRDLDPYYKYDKEE